MPNKSNKNLNKIIGHHLYDARVAANLTQKELGSKLGYAENHISTVERGLCKISVDLLLGYCNALNISPNEILKYKSAINTELLFKISKLPKEQQIKISKIIDVITE